MKKKNLESLMLEVYYELNSHDYEKIRTLLKLIYLRGHQDCMIQLEKKQKDNGLFLFPRD